MKILCESSVLDATAFYSEMGQLERFETGQLSADDLTDVDALLVRSTTSVTADLLSKASQLTFVGTATAGTNHIDKAALEARGIRFASGAGCNAVAVAEYVISALFNQRVKLAKPLPECRVGIVGAGHVGTALSGKLAALGIDFRLCDPPLKDSGDPRDFYPLDELMDCDVISLHVPLVKEGPYPTERLFDATRLSQLSEQQCLINACRGEVVDNQALLKQFEGGRRDVVIMDVFDNEPDINTALIPYLTLATAHIAGHTIEGKVRGTEMLYRALCEHIGQAPIVTLNNVLPPWQGDIIDVSGASSVFSAVQQAVCRVYDIAADDKQFRAEPMSAERFQYIRRHYPIRREFAAAQVNTGNSDSSKALYSLGFDVNTQ